MKDKKAYALGAVALTALLAGCSTNNMTAATGPKETAAGNKVTITAQGFKPDQKEKNDQLDQRINRFKAKFPNVDFKKDDWQYNPLEIGVKMASNSAPTEYTTYATEGKVLVNKKWVADMTDSMNAWDHAKDMNDLLSKPFVVNGKTYGVPVDGYVMTITLNKKLFKEKGMELPPIDWTWDDLLDAARKISDPAKGIAGFIPMGKGPEAGWNWTNFLYAAGGDVQKLDNGKVVSQFNSEAGVKALEFYKKLKDENLIPQNWALGYGDALNAFSQGRGAMVMCGSGNAADTAINEGGISKEDLVVYPIPSMSKGGKHTGVLGGNYRVINPKADKQTQQIAFKWITDEYFTDEFLGSTQKEIEDRKGKNRVYIPQPINYWNDSSDFGKKYSSLLAKYDNVFKYDPQLLRLWDGKPEAQYEAQKYYTEMANAIQKIFTTKNVDLKKTLEETSDKLQSEVFDKVKVE
ncbi:ABC-type glycerol-3-phosphate transport system, substrate-binding protein [Paenibacillus sp. 1_12]|uniref:ABC transporter substrate-binding protein n=1 Tax=Paenibacillus sp. 1_12 TaxID=1566278 RepID=UPI0008ED0D67|nr:sugar ABC transporter substrate-binding protein [Paenibacillus sp. 1_12]SFL21101.1 ABC-type glycerol-3-phosphate transport system, substrate-binding protein [Paenibacillus sp. 1_12]